MIGDAADETVRAPTRTSRPAAAKERSAIGSTALDVAFLFAAKAAIGAWVLHTGFTHVSDDDYARVVIAQSFAHAPALDPTSTSWLPFPFWLTGGLMMLVGRSLEAARAVAFVLGVVSVGLPYGAMRAIGCGRATAIGALLVAMALPWSAWLGVSTVPEAMTACLIAAGALTTTATGARTRLIGAACLLVATLSRYEAWPVCAVFAISGLPPPRPSLKGFGGGWRIGSVDEIDASSKPPTKAAPPLSPRSLGEGRGGGFMYRLSSRALAISGPLRWRIGSVDEIDASSKPPTKAAPPLSPRSLGEGRGGGFMYRLSSRALAISGPLLWLAWNAHAHGDPLHFLARVAAYRQSIGAASEPLVTKLAAFPIALVVASPMIVGLAALGTVAFVKDAAVRARWTWPLVSAFSILAFLVYGDAHDGAPTHHPERAVIPILWILALYAADSLRALVRRVAWARPAREMWVVGASMAAAVAWSVTLPARWSDHPATADDESRAPQIARGLALASDPAASHLTVTPCAYEHFALLAAFASPERADVRPPTHEPVTPICPHVDR